MDLSFWKFIIIISFAKSLLWGKDNDTYFFHIGTFSDPDHPENTALKIIFLFISINIAILK
jgi:hypothetical protein